MFTRPAEIGDALLIRAVEERWALRISAVTYQAVGFGGHHWLAEAADGVRLFLTVDDLTAKRRDADETADGVYERLAAVFSTVGDLALPFAVAPLTTRDGAALVRLAPGYSLVAHPFVEAEPVGGFGDYRSADDARAVVDMLVEVHRATPRAAGAVPVEDFAVPNRGGLEALMRMREPWRTGPFAERARALLATHADAVVRLLRAYDELAAHARKQPDRMVLTHGEPHPGNVLRAADRLLLIDWDTARSAPPERDLWWFARSHPDLVRAYTAATGTAVDDDVVTLFQLLWDLSDICGYFELFAAPHDDSQDVAESWENLNYYLRPAQRWPQFA